MVSAFRYLYRTSDFILFQVVSFPTLSLSILPMNRQSLEHWVFCDSKNPKISPQYQNITLSSLAQNVICVCVFLIKTLFN